MCGNIFTGILQACLLVATTADDFLPLMLNELKNCYCLSQQVATTSGLPGSAKGWAFFLY